MSTQHTPGPWTNHGRIPQPGLPHSAVAAKTLIARVYSEAFGDEAQEKANADLIAAAPDQNAALIALRAYLSKCPPHREDITGAEWGRMMDLSGAAIAKATGESK
jgi:hypothetical protein